MANPRKRKAIKDGRMEKMIKQKDEVIEKEVVVEETKTVKTSPPMDSFIAKELEEIERIPSEKKKVTKKKVTKKKTTTKTKKGSK